jgi:hypothetical protein
MAPPTKIPITKWLKTRYFQYWTRTSEEWWQDCCRSTKRRYISVYKTSIHYYSWLGIFFFRGELGNFPARTHGTQEQRPLLLGKWKLLAGHF